MENLFLCKFNAPVLITDEQPLSNVLEDFYNRNMMPFMIAEEHPLIDSMQKNFPDIPFARIIMSVEYDKPFSV